MLHPQNVAVVHAQRPLNTNTTIFGIGVVGVGAVGAGIGVATTTIRPSLRGFSTFSDGGFGGAFGGSNGFGANAQQRKLSGRQSSRNALDPPRQQLVIGGGAGGSAAAALPAAAQHPTGVIVSQTSDSGSSSNDDDADGYGSFVGGYGSIVGGYGGNNDGGSVAYGTYGSPGLSGINGGGIVGFGNSGGYNNADNGGVGNGGPIAGTGIGSTSSSGGGSSSGGMSGLYSQMGRGRKQSFSDLKSQLSTSGRPSDDPKNPQYVLKQQYKNGNVSRNTNILFLMIINTCRVLSLTYN